jgi:hypothetical protein
MRYQIQSRKEGRRKIFSPEKIQNLYKPRTPFSPGAHLRNSDNQNHIKVDNSEKLQTLVEGQSI